MSDAPPKLYELQAQFQAAVLRGEAQVLAYIPGSSRASNEALFGVYAHALVARLVGVLKGEHRCVRAYLGCEAFDRVARGYVRAHPSRTPNARWYAAGFPEHLRAVNDDPAASDLAEIERALGLAFDAADEPLLDLAALSSIPADAWAGLVFVPHASARALQLTTNAHAIWQAIVAEIDVPRGETLAKGQMLLVWRRDGSRPSVRALPPEEAMLWAEMSAGRPFGRLCELGAQFSGGDGAPQRVASVLASWLGSGALTGYRLAESDG